MISIFKKCKYKQHGYGDVKTSCGELLDDYDVKGYIYCPMCGKKIEWDEELKKKYEITK